jgi:hypothetical protein
MNITKTVNVFFQSLLESASYVMPAQGIPFFLVTIKAYVESIKNISLFLLFFFLLYVFRTISICSYDKHALLILSFATAIYVLTARASIGIKNISYFTRIATIIKTAIIVASVVVYALFLSYISCYVCSHDVVSVIKYIICVKPFVSFSCYTGAPSLFVLTSPLVLFFMLFLYDAYKSVISYAHSYVQALTMFIFNYIFCAIVYHVVWIIIGAIFWTLSFVIPGWVIALLLFMTIIPLYICLLINFYIKRVHDQFDVYYTHISAD